MERGITAPVYRYIIAEFVGPSVLIFGNHKVSILTSDRKYVLTCLDQNLNLLLSTPRRVFGSVDRIAPLADESRPPAQKFIGVGVSATEKLSDLETTFRGTTKRLSLRIATGLVNTIAQTAGLPSPESLANQVAGLSTSTSRYVRSCIVILTLGDDLRFLKEKEDLHTLLGALLDARDMLLQMQSDSDEMRNALQIYKLLDKMIDKMGDVKDFGSKAVQDSTRIFSSCKSNLRRLTYGKQDASTITEPEQEQGSEETISSAAPRMREILASLTDQWPDLLKTVDELKPHLEKMAEKLDAALEVKSSEAEA
jgi:CRISPR/Cas system CSM-associated protein Csm2 small subunit